MNCQRKPKPHSPPVHNRSESLPNSPSHYPTFSISWSNKVFLDPFTLLHYPKSYPGPIIQMPSANSTSKRGTLQTIVIVCVVRFKISLTMAQWIPCFKGQASLKSITSAPLKHPIPLHSTPTILIIPIISPSATRGTFREGKRMFERFFRASSRGASEMMVQLSR